MDNHFDDENQEQPSQLPDQSEDRVNAEGHLLDDGVADTDTSPQGQDTTSFNFPNWNKETPAEKPKWSLKRKLIVFGSAALAAATLATTLSLLPKDTSNSNPTDATTPPATDTASPSPSESQTPPSTETFKSTGEVQVQTTSVEAMDQMSVADFAKLLYGDRFAYFRAKIPQLDVSTPTNDQGTNPSSNFKISDVIVSDYWQNIITSAIGASDSTVREKLISVLDYVVADPNTGEYTDVYKSLKNLVDTTGGANTGTSTGVKPIDNGMWQSGVDDNGKPIDYVNITYATEDFSTQTVMATTTAQVVRVQVKLLDGSTVIGYPGYHSVPGHAIPVGTTY